jgi:hypothetical protein
VMVPAHRVGRHQDEPHHRAEPDYTGVGTNAPGAHHSMLM